MRPHDDVARWRQSKELVERALAIDPDKRAAFLDQACGSDEELHAEAVAQLSAIESGPSLLGTDSSESGEALERLAEGEVPARFAALLQAHLQPNLDPTVAAPRDERDPEETLPFVAPDRAAGPSGDPGSSDRWIDHYRILSVLGEGGMGIVFRAEQTGAIRRDVALKVLKAGIGSSQVVARFEGERQALAAMNHPHVAKIYDAGVTDDRCPYFAMELVTGEAITDFCDEARLTIKERLEVFLLVCDAVQHAHRRGIIHRDLKPSNILLSRLDGKLVPKVIDFGISKAIARRFDPSAAATVEGMIIGTPEYMSPEQADGAVDDIDTRSDVYSLGVTLYELLTGQLPFDPTTLRKAGYSEVQRQIREVTPPVPSTRVRNATSSDVAHSRRLEPNQLRNRLRGDLDAIVMKALEKSRRHRYASPAELADDILRYLELEPVLAGRTSRVRQAWKFLLRHRSTIALGLLVASLLVGVTFGREWQQFSVVAIVSLTGLLVASLTANRRVRQAMRSEHRARNRAEEQREIAERSRALASQHLDDVLRLSDMQTLSELTDEAEELWPAVPSRLSAMESWLDRARNLASRLEVHESFLARLRESAAPYSAADERADLERNPASAELERRTKEASEVARLIASTESPPESTLSSDETDGWTDAERTQHVAALRKQAAELDKKIAVLQRESKRRLTWRLRSTEEQWWHNHCQELVDKLKEFVAREPEGALRSIERRIQVASTLEERTITSSHAAARWDAAIQDIAHSTIYDGVQLSPQLGLLPLRRDPNSGLWEFWHCESGTEPRPAPSDTSASPWLIEEDTGVILVLLPGGEFQLGAQAQDSTQPNFDEAANTNEGPVHPVQLDPFYIGRYPMTQGQWKRLSGENPSAYAENRNYGGKQHDLRHPVESVSWVECHRVLRRVEFVLPTEAQWEYAARGGTDTPWWSGAKARSLVGVANLADRFARANGAPAIWEFEEWLDDGYTVHSPVDSFRPNPFGLHDAHGNVWEWCRDGAGDYDEPDHEPGTGERLSGDQTRAVYRGGSYQMIARLCRVTNRGINARTYRGASLGVRAARALHSS